MRAQGIFVVRHEFGFAFKRYIPGVSLIKREFAGKSYQIARHPHIYLGRAPVELIAFNEPHKNMVAPVLQTNQPLNNGIVANYYQLINSCVGIFKFGFPIK